MGFIEDGGTAGCNVFIPYGFVTAAWESAPDLFRAMLNANKIPKKSITGFIEDMMAGGILDEVINETLDAVRDFSEEGED